MEVEAKFSIPDEQTFQRLLEATSLAGFSLEEPALLDLHDQYLDTRWWHHPRRWVCLPDTPARRPHPCHPQGIGHSLRRHSPPHRTRGRTATTAATPAMAPKRRPRPGPAPEWRRAPRLSLWNQSDPPPPPPVRGDHVVAELNLDRVRLCRETKTAATYLELEAELLPGCSEEILDQLAEELQTEWGLLPQNRSKFERGLALLGPRQASRKEHPTVIDVQPPGMETMNRVPPPLARSHHRQSSYSPTPASNQTTR